jgi:multidrug efflux pump subunit AcrA (membrane-fusion protein)
MKLNWILILAVCIGCGETHHEAREEPGHAEEGVVHLSAEAIAAGKIQSAEVRTGSGWITTRFPGRIEYNKDITAAVSSPLEGRLHKWLANVGDAVRAGDVLAHVQNPQNLDVPILIKAPLDGKVVERKSALGEWVKPEDALFVIGDLSRVWAIAEVREDMVGKVLAEAPATVRVLSYRDESFAAKLLRSRTEVEPETRTVEFLLEVPNPDGKLRPGMFAYISLATGNVDEALLVPDEAVQTIAGKPTVFVEEEPGHYHAVEITLGQKLGDQHEVLAGLTAGARVVTTGSFILKSELLRAEMGEGHAH